MCDSVLSVDFRLSTFYTVTETFFINNSFWQQVTQINHEQNQRKVCVENMNTVIFTGYQSYGKILLSCHHKEE